MSTVVFENERDEEVRCFQFATPRTYIKFILQ